MTPPEDTVAQRLARLQRGAVQVAAISSMLNDINAAAETGVKYLAGKGTTQSYSANALTTGKTALSHS